MKGKKLDVTIYIPKRESYDNRDSYGRSKTGVNFPYPSAYASSAYASREVSLVARCRPDYTKTGIERWDNYDVGSGYTIPEKILYAATKAIMADLTGDTTLSTLPLPEGLEGILEKNETPKGRHRIMNGDPVVYEGEWEFSYNGVKATATVEARIRDDPA